MPYSQFAELFPFCFACHAPWYLDIAHIVGGSGRVDDRRDIVRLCRQCHMLNHGATILKSGVPLPKISLENMLALKLEHDPVFFDVPFLQSLRIKRHEPLEPKRLDDWFYRQREKFPPLPQNKQHSVDW